jgi:plastocyanin
VGDGDLVENSTFGHTERGISITGRDNEVRDCHFTGCDVGVVLGSFPGRVLLMGNSYTQANALDVITRHILDETVPDPVTARLTSGGLTLADHAHRARSSGSLWNKTLNGHFNRDHVILQDQSQIPGFPTSDQYWKASLAGAKVLDGMIEEVGAETVLMMTWGRRDGDLSNPSLYPNFTAMQDRLENGYQWYAENLSTPERPVYIAPVGLAFKHIHDEIVDSGGDPTQPGTLFHSLYSSDGSHPSKSGSSLAAAVLYATLTGNSPVGLQDGTGLTIQRRLALQEAAEATVFNETPDYVYPWRESTGALLDNNTFEGGDSGLYVGCNSSNNTVTDNALSNATGPAIVVMDANSHHNTFHHNGFLDNNEGAVQALDRGTDNAWDDGAEGNYWSNYEDRYPGAANDGNVWATPYTLVPLGGGADRYPFVVDARFMDIGPPTADAGPDSEVPEGALVSLNGSGSTDDRGVIIWTWTFPYDGDTVVLRGETTQFIFDIPGVYQVVLVVMDAAGNWGKDQVNVTVLDTTDPEASIALHAGGVQFETATLDGSASTDNVAVVNWTWTIDHKDQHAVLYGMIVEFTFQFAGNYSIELTVSDAAGNRDTDTLVTSITSMVSPVADAGPDQEVPQGTIVYFDGSGSRDNVGIDHFKWTFTYLGETVILSGVAPSHFFGEVGVHTITLAVWDLGSLCGYDIVNITVLDVTAPFADAGDDVEVEQGTTVTFDAGASSDNVGIVAWSWELRYNGSTAKGSEDTFIWTFETAGLWTLRLTVEDAAGNSDTDMIGVTVIDVTPPTAFAPSYNVAMGDTVAFDGSHSLDNVGIREWTWVIELPGEDEVLTGEFPTFEFGPPGNYDYTLTVEDAAGNSEKASGLVTVRDTVPPVVPRFEDITIKSHGTLVLDASGATDNVGVVRYLWYYEVDGREEVVALDGNRVEHQFPGEGDYTVHLTVWDEEGNTETTTFTVHVEDSLLIWVPVICGFLIAVVVAFIVIQRRKLGR